MADVEAYLDIETTGLSPFYGEVTVVGIYRVCGDDSEFLQLVGEEITGEKVLDALKNVNTIYTYNGSRFDLPFLDVSLGVDLCDYFQHRDLMYDCWRCHLKGGLKTVERTLGIDRELTEVNGYMAVILWHRYIRYGDAKALETLLAYNKEDVVNLKTLRHILENTLS